MNNTLYVDAPYKNIGHHYNINTCKKITRDNWIQNIEHLFEKLCKL